LTLHLAVNPALPLLALLAAAGPILIVWRPAVAGSPRRAWRELGVPWAVLGLAGIGLLAPALQLPTGIPSPAASLAGLPPWQAGGAPAAAGMTGTAGMAGTGGAPAGLQGREGEAVGAPAEPQAPLGREGAAAGAAAEPQAPLGREGAAAASAERGNPVLRDVTFQIQPWLLFARRELRAGRLPGWNPYQFAGSPFWANGQSAPLFPLHLLFTALPLQLGFILLPWLRLVLGGCGVWMLARELGLGPQAALLAALTFALSGMPVSFVLFPMGNALALVPWVFWAVERVAVAGRGALVPAVAWLAAAAGLQLLGGHPETAAHTALLSLLYLAMRGTARPAAAWLGWAAGWLGGAALAAVQLLPLALTLPETARWQAAAGGGEPPLGLLLRQPLRLVLPELYGHPAHGTWWGPFNYSATAVYAGALALPLAAAGLARCRRDRRWLALAATAAFAFAAAYHWPGVRDLMAALPVLGRAAHHRLLFGVELGLALLAGAGCDEWLAGRGRGLLGGAAAAAAALAVAWALFRGDWAAHGLLATEAAWTAAVAAAAALLALSLRLGSGRRWRLAPLLPALALCDLLAAHGGINPGLPLARLYPPTGAVRFLAGRPERVAGVGEALRPNAAMVYGLYDPRGDDPVKLVRYEAVYRHFAAADPVYFQPVSRWDSPWLDQLGVRWVVAAAGEAAPASGWRLAYAGGDARVYERPGALPLVRWAAPSAPRQASPQAPGSLSSFEVPAPQSSPAAAARAAPGSPAAMASPDSPAAKGSPGSPAAMASLGSPAVKGSPASPAAMVSLGSPAAKGSPAAPGGKAGLAAQVAMAAAGLEVLRRDPGRWEIAWRSAEPRLLEVAESWAPGWRAWVDGAPRPVEAAGALLGVRLGGGAGRLELRYRPPGLVAGAAVSVAALLGLVGAGWRRPRDREPQPGGAS